MAHMVKVFAARPDDPSPRSGIYMVERKSNYQGLPGTHCMYGTTHTYEIKRN